MSAFLLGTVTWAVQEEALTWFSAWATPRFPDTCFLHTHTTRSSGKHHWWLWRQEHENSLAPFSPDILVCPDRSTSAAGQKEDAGKLCAMRAGRHHTRSEGTAEAETSSALQTWSTECLCSLTRSTAPSPLCPLTAHLSDHRLKTLHKGVLLFGLLHFQFFNYETDLPNHLSLFLCLIYLITMSKSKLERTIKAAFPQRPSLSLCHAHTVVTLSLF